ncbi:hypothetical protein LTR27_001181 [Elasticomyces elasticus]|nr:hypothetical protein LTR27_001181 [Elasticomyces elasticus]
MGNVTYTDGIAIWKVIYYFPALFASIYICCRHGFLKSSGWMFLVTFCLTRIIGSCAQLATISHPNSSTAETIALICAFMGTSPLLLSSLGLISRIYYDILTKMWSMLFQLCALKIVQMPAVIGFILCIVGATSASDPSKVEHQAMVQAGIILYCVVLLMLVILTFIAVLYRSKMPASEIILIRAVVAALPLIAIHLLYSLIATFGHLHAFSATTDSPTVSLFMSVIEEMFVVVIYIAAGLKLESTPLDEDDSGAKKLGYRLGRGDFGTGKLGLLSLLFGIVGVMREGQGDEEKHQSRQQSNLGQKEGQSQHRHDSHDNHQHVRRERRNDGQQRREEPGHFEV